MPPSEAIAHLCKTFDVGVYTIVNALLRGRLAEAPDALWQRDGCGFLKYSDHFSVLYEETKRAAAQGKSASPGRLVNHITSSASGPEPADPVQQQQQELNQLVQFDTSNQWMFYSGRAFDLQPAEFVAALAIKLELLPEKVRLPILCDCKTNVMNEKDFIRHTLACDKFTNFGFTARHNTVMYDALLPVARAFGISTTVEPRCYTYANGQRKRPDIIFHVHPKLAIDVTVVIPGNTIGVRAAAEAQQKNASHKEAVEALGHVFSPFAAEIFGFLDQSAHNVIRRLAATLPTLMRVSFYRDVYQAVSTALARGRAAAINSAISKQVSAEANWRGVF